MSTRTLDTSHATDETIEAAHVNDITSALLEEVVGRDSTGVAAQGQSLGTTAVPWGEGHFNSLVVNGEAIDFSTLSAENNRVISGETRSTSIAPYFIRVNARGSGNRTFRVEASRTNLVVSINGTEVTVSSDITSQNVTLAPTANNTCNINNSAIGASRNQNTAIIGQSDSAINHIGIDNVGTEITSRVGQEVAMRGPFSEIFICRVENSTTLSNCLRGYFYDDDGENTIDDLANDNRLTLLSLGWVFLDRDGSTLDISYTSPVTSFTAPSGPATGDYWYSLEHNNWRRYNGTTWVIINRILIGQVVADNNTVLAARCVDFSNEYNSLSGIKLRRMSPTIIEGTLDTECISVYGNTLRFRYGKIQWNTIGDSVETSTARGEQSYLYITEHGRPRHTTVAPHYRRDLQGYYHQLESWRCVGVFFYRTSNDVSVVTELESNRNIYGRVWHEASQNTNGGSISSTGFTRRTLNRLHIEGHWLSIQGNNSIFLPRGVYLIRGAVPYYGQAANNILGVAARINIGTTGRVVGQGTNAYVEGSSVGGSVFVSALVAIDQASQIYIEMRIGRADSASFTGGRPTNFGPEIYTNIEVIKLSEHNDFRTANV